MTRDRERAPGEANRIGDTTEVVAYDQAIKRSGRHPGALGRYTLDHILAEGGMAEVWLASVDGPGGFQKKVVVKRIRPSLVREAARRAGDSARAVEMFVREARLLASLAHRHIVQVYELGVEQPKSADGLAEHFIVMEYLEGQTLRDLALRLWDAKRPLPLETAIRIVADACVGLDHAHRLKDANGASANLVHRDISPDNIFITNTGVVKLLDFGIARREDWSGLTQVGELKGKVPFMSPEQLKGQRIDGRTDIFAIGVVLYWLLGGRRPFDGPSDVFTMKAILDDDPRPLRELNPAVPSAIDDLVVSCLQKDPDQRMSSAAALHDSLSMILMGVSGLGSTDLADLVAAANPLPLPGFEVVPDVAATPVGQWERNPASLVRATGKAVPMDASTPLSSSSSSSSSSMSAGMSAGMPKSFSGADASSSRARVKASDRRATLLAEPAVDEPDTLFQVDPADVPSTLPPSAALTNPSVSPAPQGLGVVSSDGPTQQQPAARLSLLPLPPVPSVPPVPPVPGVADAPTVSPARPALPPNLGPATPSSSSSSSPSPPVTSPTGSKPRASWRDQVPAEMRDTVDLGAGALEDFGDVGNADTRRAPRPPPSTSGFDDIAVAPTMLAPTPATFPDGESADGASVWLRVLGVGAGAALAVGLLVAVALVAGVFDEDPLGPDVDTPANVANPSTGLVPTNEVQADAGAVDAVGANTDPSGNAGVDDPMPEGASGDAGPAGQADQLATGDADDATLDADDGLEDGDEGGIADGVDDGTDGVDDGADPDPTPRRRRNPYKRPRRKPTAPTTSTTAAHQGFLVVRARPWAKVSIDRIPIGTTPLPALPMAAGKHIIVLQHEGITKNVTVNITSDKTSTVQIDMRVP